MNINENIYALPVINEIKLISDYKIDSRAQIICSVVYSVAVSISKSPMAFFLALLVPLFLSDKSILKTLLKINLINIFMIIVMILTWPSKIEGVKIGFLITLRLNLIFIVFLKLFKSIGQQGFYRALNSKIVPEKIRLLVILTVRGIFILSERFNAAILSVKLRAPGIKNFLKWKTLAYMTSSVLLQSSVHSEKMSFAIKCRGGFKGFSQFNNDIIWQKHDTIFCVISIIYSIFILISNIL